MKKRVYCHKCKEEYVIDSDKSIEDFQKDHKCKYCDNDFLYIEKDRGHRIYFRFTEHNILY